MTSKKQFYITVATFLAILYCYLYIDQSTAWWVHTHVSSQYRELFKIITEFGDSTYYLIGFALLFFLFRFLWKKSSLERISLFLFASVASSGIVADIVKVIAGRYRPSELLAQGLYGFDFWHVDRALTSFPSGHTTTAFTLAAAITYLWPKTGIIMWPIALLIGISRIMIGAHYPSDVIGGVFVGIFSTLIVIRYFEQKSEGQSLSH